MDKKFQDILVNHIKLGECIGANKYKCILIEAGETKSANLPLNINGQLTYVYKNYTAEAIQEAVESGLFENAPALIRDKDSHLSAQNTGINSYVGNFTNVVYNVVTKCAEGIFNPIEKIKSKLSEVWKSVDLSIAAEISGFIYKNTSGKLGIAVKKINRVQSVDLVDGGNAGGTIVALVAESLNNNSQSIFNLKTGESFMNPETKLLIFNFLNAAGLIGEGKTIDTISDDDLLNALWQHTMTLVNTQDTSVAESRNTAFNLIEKLFEGKFKIAESTNQSNSDNVLTLLTKLQNDMNLSNSQNYLNIKVAESKLPTPIKDKIHKLFDGQNLTNQQIDNILTAEQDAYSKFDPAIINNAGADIKVGQETIDKFKLQLDYLMIAPESRIKLTTAEQEEFKNAGVGNMSFLELYRHFTGDYRVSGRLAKGSLAESVQGNMFKLRTGETIISTSFAQLFGDSLHRSMLLEFRTSPFNNDWTKFFQIGTRTDFKTNTLIGVGGEDDLPVVNELQEYSEADDATEYASTYKLLKRGYTKVISQEAILNDDLGYIRGVPVKIGRAAARTLYKYAFNMILTNPNMAYDTKALIHADHLNKLTVAFSKENYWEAIKLLADQVEESNGEKLGLIPKYLLINMADAPLAYELTTPAAMLANNVPSFYQTYRIEPIIVATQTNRDWRLIADPSTATLGEIGFLNGNQEPEFFTQDNPNLGFAFSNDGIKIKVKHTYAGTLADHRAIVGSLIPSQ